MQACSAPEKGCTNKYHSEKHVNIMYFSHLYLGLPYLKYRGVREKRHISRHQRFQIPDSDFPDFRNSDWARSVLRLTILLRDAIGGSGYTLMLACISVLDSNWEENLSTLQYATGMQRLGESVTTTGGLEKQLAAAMKKPSGND